MTFDLALDIAPNVADALNGTATTAAGVTTFATDLWSTTELWEYADETLNQIALHFGLFVERTDVIAIVSGSGDYPLPIDHIATHHADLDSTVLRPASVRELEALDAVWEEATGAVEKFSLDHLGLGTLRLYRIPNATANLYLVYRQFPAQVTSTNTTVRYLSDPVADVVGLHVIAEARRRESDAQMSEVVEACEGVIAVYEQLFEAYWGKGIL